MTPLLHNVMSNLAPSSQQPKRRQHDHGFAARAGVEGISPGAVAEQQNNPSPPQFTVKESNENGTDSRMIVTKDNNEKFHDVQVRSQASVWY